MKCLISTLLAFAFSLINLPGCKNKSSPPYQTLVASVDLKRGNLVACGPQEGQYGTTFFSADVPEDLRADFNTGIALLHSFEYDESEKMFAKVIDKAPQCAMAWWGVAMSNFHPLWSPPTPAELKKGARAVEIADEIPGKSKRESDYIDAIGDFYKDAATLDHRTRVLRFEKAMERIYLTYKDDREAPVFYALALNAAADPTDKTYSRQKKAFALLNEIFQQEPLHPGIAHYIIHNYDYPDLAEMALPAARKYASIAPASAHAQHMPSHIFTRLGLWDECIQSNLVAVASAKCYAESADMKGHWDEELHGLDYLVYAYLQKADDSAAKKQFDYLRSMTEVNPVNFKVLFSFAAIPARYYLEKRMWKEAASLDFYPAQYPWSKFPWQKATVHFARAMGSVHTNQLAKAKTELDSLRVLHAVLAKEKNQAREASQVMVQINTVSAWIHYKEKNIVQAIELMTTAADQEDATEKLPVTPGEILPARELLGDMLMATGQPAAAYQAYMINLQSHPKRFNGLYGAAIAAEKMGNQESAVSYYRQLVNSCIPTASRSEITHAKTFITHPKQ